MERIRVERGAFSRILADAGVFAGRSRVRPVLNNISVATRNACIRIESSDGDSCIRCYEKCDSTADMAFCVDARALTAYIGLLEDEYVTMDYDKEGCRLIIEHSGGKAELPTVDFGEFPTMKAMGEGTEIELSGSILADWLTSAGNFAMKSDLGVVLEGIYVYANPEFLGVCGGEHSQIFTARMPNSMGIPDFGVVLPQISAAIMAKMCATSEKVTLKQNGNALFIRTDDTIVCSSLLNLKYPNISRLFDQIGHCRVEIDKMTLLQAVKRIEPQTVKENVAVRLHSTGTSLELHYNAEEFNKNLGETIPCEGDAFDDVAVNLKHLRNILSNYRGDKVVFYHDNSERSPFFFENRRDGSLELYLLAVTI